MSLHSFYLQVIDKPEMGKRVTTMVDGCLRRDRKTGKADIAHQINPGNSWVKSVPLGQRVVKEGAWI